MVRAAAWLLAVLCCVLCCLVLTWAFSAAFLVLDLTPFTSPRTLIAEALVAAQRTDRREGTIAVRAEESAAHRTRFSEALLAGQCCAAVRTSLPRPSWASRYVPHESGSRTHCIGSSAHSALPPLTASPSPYSHTIHTPTYRPCRCADGRTRSID